jgi:nitrate/nitrite transporter NarK
VLLFIAESVLQILGLSHVQFFPTLTATLGYSTTNTLLLAAPPWIWSALVCLFIGWSADRTGERFFHIGACWWGTMIAFIIGLSTMNIAARYISLFLMASGFAGFAMNLTWVSNAVPRPPAKRAAAMGLVNGIGNLGNLIGSYVWDAKWGPAYHQSFAICLASLAGSTIISFIIRQMIIQRNKQMLADELKDMSPDNKLRVEEAARIEGISFEEAMAKRRGFKLLY